MFIRIHYYTKMANKKANLPGLVVHTSNPSIQEAETGGLQVQIQSGLQCSGTWLKKINKANHFPPPWPCSTFCVFVFLSLIVLTVFPTPLLVYALCIYQYPGVGGVVCFTWNRTTPNMLFCHCFCPLVVLKFSNSIFFF